MKIIDRIEKAISAVCSNRIVMHVPPFDSDVDVVLSDCRTVIEDQQKQIKEALEWVEDLKREREFLQKKCAERADKIDAVEKLPSFWRDFINGFPHISIDSKVQLIQCADELEQALKSSKPQTQAPQSCNHTMAEKTQFGDLERTFECIFCDYKTTEAWVEFR